jgi:hypothetical protein
MTRKPVGMPPSACRTDVLPMGASLEEWLDVYYAAEERLGDYAVRCALGFRARLGDDLLATGDMISDAYIAVWEVAWKIFTGRVLHSERGLLVWVLYHEVRHRFVDELQHARPQSVAVRKYAKKLAALEKRIADAEENGTPWSETKKAKKRRQLETDLALSPSREYPEDGSEDLPSDETGIPEVVLEKLDPRPTAEQMIAQIRTHPRMAEGKRQRYAFEQLLLHSGGDVPGEAWTAMGWTVGTGRVLLHRVKAFLRSTFPEFAELVL